MARAHGFTIIEKLAKLLGLILILGVLVAGLLLPYVGGGGLAAKAGADKFLSTDCTLTEEPVQQKTTVLASDGKTVIAELFDQNRQVVSLKQIPKNVVNALIATEDRRFYDHHGVDLRGIIRAAFATGSGSTQGASTLTEQYVKQVAYYQANTPEEQQAAIDQNIDRKISDAKCALEIEKKYNKPTILEKYLNIAFFGENSYGIQTAANTYFGVDVSKLSLPQAAMLVGLVKSPSILDPFVDIDAARARRDLVLTNMAAQGYVTEAQAARAKSQPIKLATHKTPERGCAYANPNIKNVGFFCDYATKWLKDVGGLTPQRVATGGWKIVTTLDVNMQNQVQTSIWNDMPPSFYGDKKQDPTPSAAIMPGLDPTSGAVKFFATSRQYGSGSANKTTNPIFTTPTAGAGSTFKYFTAVAGLKLGLKDSFSLTTGDPYHTKQCPPDSDPKPNGYHNAGSYNPTQTLRSALVASSNTFFVGVEDQVFMCNLDLIVHTAKDLGYATLNDVEKSGGHVVNGKTLGENIISQQRATFTLGQSIVSPVELATAYGVAANDGVLCPATPIQSITGPDGKPVPFKRGACARRMDPFTARQVIDIMIGDTTPHGGAFGGTALGAFGPWYNAGGSQVAGKTGTNNGTDPNTGEDSGNNAALWFVGATPHLVATTAIYNPDAPTHDIVDAPGHHGDSSNAFGAVGAGLWVNALTPVMASQPWTWPSPLDIPEAQYVPDVRGFEAEEAKARLQAAGFKVAILPNQTCGSWAREGRVGLYGPIYAQTGATITLCMSSGTGTYVYAPPPAPTASRSAPNPTPTRGGGPTRTKPPRR